MKRNEFMGKRGESLRVTPRKLNRLVGRSEEEVAFWDDVMAMDDNRCLFINENIDLAKLKIRYQGNDYWIKSMREVPGEISIVAKTKVWHEPTKVPRT